MLARFPVSPKRKARSSREFSEGYVKKAGYEKEGGFLGGFRGNKGEGKATRPVRG